MKEVCNHCAHQKAARNSRVKCGKAIEYYNGNYGPFKGGAACIHDSDLEDGFEARTGEEISIRNLSATHEVLKDKNSELRGQIADLQERLLRI